MNLEKDLSTLLRYRNGFEITNKDVNEAIDNSIALIREKMKAEKKEVKKDAKSF